MLNTSFPKPSVVVVAVVLLIPLTAQFLIASETGATPPLQVELQNSEIANQSEFAADEGRLQIP